MAVQSLGLNGLDVQLGPIHNGDVFCETFEQRFMLFGGPLFATP